MPQPGRNDRAKTSRRAADQANDTIGSEHMLPRLCSPGQSGTLDQANDTTVSEHKLPCLCRPRLTGTVDQANDTTGTEDKLPRRCSHSQSGIVDQANDTSGSEHMLPRLCSPRQADTADQANNTTGSEHMLSPLCSPSQSGTCSAQPYDTTGTEHKLPNKLPRRCSHSQSSIDLDAEALQQEELLVSHERLLADLAGGTLQPRQPGNRTDAAYFDALCHGLCQLIDITQSMSTDFPMDLFRVPRGTPGRSPGNWALAQESMNVSSQTSSPDNLATEQTLHTSMHSAMDFVN